MVVRGVVHLVPVVVVVLQRDRVYWDPRLLSRLLGSLRIETLHSGFYPKSTHSQQSPTKTTEPPLQATTSPTAPITSSPKTLTKPFQTGTRDPYLFIQFAKTAQNLHKLTRCQELCRSIPRSPSAPLLIISFPKNIPRKVLHVCFPDDVVGDGVDGGHV